MTRNTTTPSKAAPANGKTKDKAAAPLQARDLQALSAGSVDWGWIW